MLGTRSSAGARFKTLSRGSQARVSLIPTVTHVVKLLLLRKLWFTPLWRLTWKRRVILCSAGKWKVVERKLKESEGY